MKLLGPLELRRARVRRVVHEQAKVVALAKELLRGGDGCVGVGKVEHSNLHAHAVSGVVFLGGGTLWQAARVSELTSSRAELSTRTSTSPASPASPISVAKVRSPPS